MTSSTPPQRVHHTLTAPGKRVFVVRAAHVELTLTLATPHSTAIIYGVYRLSGTDTARIRIVQHHVAPDTRSVCVVRAIVADAAATRITTAITIDAAAHRADAMSEARALLVSPRAHAAILPQMEVCPDDMRRCTHAATATPIDATQRAYLRTRGITDAAAVALLTTAFVRDIDDRVRAAGTDIVIV